MPKRLVVFDVDGTLVDSQADIISSMTAAFAVAELDLPSHKTILSGVGLSLEVLMPMLAPDAEGGTHKLLVQAYKDSYMASRQKIGAAQSSPLYPGARDILETLRTRDDLVLGVATGKSKRGLDKLIEGHGFENMFVTRQVADFHPSKPHPSMLQAAMQEAGVQAKDAVMIGDTSYDMDMAAGAGMHSIGVTWGYHDAARLENASVLAERFEELPSLLDEIWSRSA